MIIPNMKAQKTAKEMEFEAMSCEEKLDYLFVESVLTKKDVERADWSSRMAWDSAHKANRRLSELDRQKEEKKEKIGDFFFVVGFIIVMILAGLGGAELLKMVLL